MKKGKYLAIVIALVVAVAAIMVGCGETEYSVTFSDGGSVVKTVTVEEGSALSATDFPDPTGASEAIAFDGWYVGDTKVEAGYEVTADVTVTAKYTALIAVTFTNEGESTVVYVREGETIAESAIPSDPVTGEESAFVGWYNGPTEFDPDKPITEAVEYTAEYDRLAYVIIFNNGDTNTVKYLPIEDMGATTLSSALIESNPSGNGVFLGWYSNGVKAEDGLEISDDMLFEALFVNQDDYKVSSWYDDTNKAMLIISEKLNEYEVKASITNVTHEVGKRTTIANNLTFSYSIAGDDAGSCTANNGSMGLSRVNYKLSLIGDTMILTMSGYDTYEEPCNNTYTFTAEGAVDFFGKYTNHNNEIIIDESGVVTKCGTTSSTTPPYYARAYMDAEQIKIDYKTGATTDIITLTAVVDAAGNLMISDSEETEQSYTGLFVKDVSAVVAKSVSTYKLLAYTVGGEPVIVFKDGTKYTYLELDPFEVGDIVEFNAFEQDYIFKIGSSSSLILPGEERGTYTGEGDDIYLDGFESAKIGSNEAQAYIIIGKDVLIGGSQGYEIDTDAHNYTAKTLDGYQGRFVRSNYSLVFNGMGGVLYVYTGASSSSGTEYAYVDNSDGTIKVGTSTSGGQGTYALLANGNVLAKTTGSDVYVKDGYTVPADAEKNAGEYKNGENSIVLDVYGGVVLTISGTEYKTAYVVESSQIKFSANGVAYVCTVTDGGLSVSAGGATAVDYNKPVEDTSDGFESYYIYKYGQTYFTIILDGKKGATVNGAAYTYSEANGVIKVEQGYNVYEITISTGAGTYDYGDGASDMTLVTELYGTWKNSRSSSMTFTFGLDGSVTNEEGLSGSISFSNGVITFTVGGNTYKSTSLSKTQMVLTYTYDYEDYTLTYTR